jgi:hypothetical protein
MGLTESRLRAWCDEVGFGPVRRVSVPQPYHLYEIEG